MNVILENIFQLQVLHMQLVKTFHMNKESPEKLK